MSIIFATAGRAPDPCLSAPTISSVDNDASDLVNCPSGWDTEWSLTISGTLQAGQEYYIEYRVGSSPGAGSWNFHERTTSTTLSTISNANVSLDGLGASGTYYMTVRAYVVPTGGSTGEACSGPVTSSEINKTGDSCFE